MNRVINITNAFSFIGIIAGYFYWSGYACTNGCAITSNWYGSMILGGVFGNLIGGIISDLLKKT